MEQKIKHFRATFVKENTHSRCSRTLLTMLQVCVDLVTMSNIPTRIGFYQRCAERIAEYDKKSMSESESVVSC